MLKPVIKVLKIDFSKGPKGDVGPQGEAAPPYDDTQLRQELMGEIMEGLDVILEGENNNVG